MYADYAYYAGVYGGTAVPEDAWPRVSAQADAYIDRLTFGRLHHGWPVTDAVKMACCAVADVVQALPAASIQAVAGGVKSFNNDGYSETYGTAAEIAAGRDAALADAAGIYLPASDPLRYAGFYCRGGGCPC